MFLKRYIFGLFAGCFFIYTSSQLSFASKADNVPDLQVDKSILD
ncbi:hypothetical protein CCPUN_07780 [Cardinium endosymbiont of Culicoides punctatus]|nr:hypothetical protein CCPUN_07780 [Cardinium endosymbiont of Culicoides punctatus]